MLRSSRVAAAAAALALAGLGVASVPAAAQTSANASVTAIANVIGIAPLTASAVNNLIFGTVAAGATKTPTSIATDAGRINISGEPSYPVNITFSLPTVLTGPGSTTIPITFGGSDGILWTSYPTTSTPFNPNAVFSTTTNGSGNLVIGISGTVSPPLGTTTGTYQGTIVLTVAY